nr:DNA-directed DNA polymerase [Tanacetum cinerariifolium]
MLREPIKGNNQERNQFFQGANQSQNQPQAYQAPSYQAPVYEASVHQPQIPQPQVVTTNEFTNFMKANDVIIKNMKTNMTSLTNSNFELKNMFGQFMKMNTASSLGSGTLQGNTITNPKEDLKVVECETEATKDTVHPTNNKSTEDVQPPVVLTESPIFTFELVNSPIIEPVASPFPEKLGDPSKFLILCDFPRMTECLALGDLDASINLMPLSVWNKLSLPDLSPTCMTLELVDHSISHPVRVAEDVFVKVEVLDFSNVIASGNPTPYYDPIVSTTSPALTPFENSDFLLEEVDAFLDLEDDPTSPEVDQSYLDSEWDILLLEAFLNDDPLLPLPNQGNYLPEVCKELKICEAKTNKSSIDEPPEVKLKDLPPHLEYAFLEGEDKLLVIIAKDLSVEEKTALITVLKSHKRAIAWKLSDIKGIDHEFCTHKILMEEDFKPAVQHQKRVNPKIHDVIKQEVLKLLDAGLIYLIFDSTFQRCMMAIFHDMIEKTLEVFMDDFSVFENSFQSRLSNLKKMLKRCEDTNLCLNWEKSHFMVKEGIVLGHKISKEGIEVDKAKFDVITKLPHPTTVKGIRSFLGHAGFYRRFIKDFSKIAMLMTDIC